jgi:hypothetical protein
MATVDFQSWVTVRNSSDTRQCCSVLPDFGRAGRYSDAVPVHDRMGGFSGSETRNDCAGRQGNHCFSFDHPDGCHLVPAVLAQRRYGLA